ncbi:MAG TPA: TIGR00296 family protein [Thermoplasmata archaeon]|nr:TIGR00296 family protein [Thermoplasmata archaeon]
MPVTLDEARLGLSLARRSIERALAPDPPADPAAPFEGERLPPLFDERRGVFVTLKRAESGALRGCIGYPLPVEPLRVGLPRVAAAAALEDPRFPPVTPTEWPRLAVEISLLTAPEPLRARDAPGRRAEVVVGRDGLIVEARGTSGLLLPQVPVEEGWDSGEFLSGTCEKAGLPPDAWLDLRTRVFRFEGEVFRETGPGGPVERVELSGRSSGPDRRA